MKTQFVHFYPPPLYYTLVKKNDSSKCALCECASCYPKKNYDIRNDVGRGFIWTERQRCGITWEFRRISYLDRFYELNNFQHLSTDFRMEWNVNHLSEFSFPLLLFAVRYPWYPGCSKFSINKNQSIQSVNTKWLQK